MVAEIFQKKNDSSTQRKPVQVALDAFSKKSQWQSAQEIVTLGSEHLASCSHRNAARNGMFLVDTHCTCLKHDRLHCFTSCYKQIKPIEYPISSISYHIMLFLNIPFVMPICVLQLFRGIGWKWALWNPASRSTTVSSHPVLAQPTGCELRRRCESWSWDEKQPRNLSSNGYITIIYHYITILYHHNIISPLYQKLGRKSRLMVI